MPSLLSATSSRPWLRLWIPLALALAGLAALPADLPLARWWLSDHFPADNKRFFNTFESYAHGFGVAAILLTVLVLDRRRQLFPRVLAITLAAGLTADVLKLLLARTRPNSFFTSGTATDTVWETFGQWLPLSHAGSAHQSFPSGHMAAAFGLTAALIWLYPRGRWLFAAFAVLAGCQRMSSGSHFLSDVLWGAMAGSLPALLMLPGGWLSCWFDRLEARTDRLALMPAEREPSILRM
jgi:membrane-associated phospholipid phosphatase